MMALLMPPTAFDAAFPEPAFNPDRFWTAICLIGVVASHVYPFVWLAVSS